MANVKEPTLRCTICNNTFSLPVDAVKIGQRKGAHQLYRFLDGSVHNLGSTKLGQNLRKAHRVEEK